MGRIINENQIREIAKKQRAYGKKIVLAGGCFDLIHLGHIKFLKKAKKEGEVLIILLESDESVKRLKGENRPINNQNERAEVLSAISYVDIVIKLKKVASDKEYDKLITQIKPHIIAATEEDSGINHKIRQAKLVDAKVVFVTEKLNNRSTSRLAKLGEIL